MGSCSAKVGPIRLGTHFSKSDSVNIITRIIFQKRKRKYKKEYLSVISKMK